MKKVSPKILHKMKKDFVKNNIELQINLKNLKVNYTNLKRIAPKTIIAACVKADSYGLGAHQTCKTLFQLKCKDYFVATIEEAISLRAIFKNINIYLLNGINDLESYMRIKNYNITIVVNNTHQFEILKSAYKATNNKIKSCIHIDSGMNRLGFNYQEFEKSLSNFIKYLDIKIIMSHMVNSENRSSFNNKQLKFFNKTKEGLRKIKNTKFSLGNSNASFLSDKFHFDMIRAGGYIYGLDLQKKNKSKNVLTLRARIIQIKNLKKGNSIGYGAKYITQKDCTIGTLAIGYADGLPRNYKGYAFLKRKKVKFVGNISMDLSCIDISGIKRVKVNDWVEIFGKNISIFDFASSCETITYEISSKIGSRVKRIYKI